jgi:hypothetical protein
MSIIRMLISTDLTSSTDSSCVSNLITNKANDPGFVNVVVVNAEDGDYHLEATSPVIDKGTIIHYESQLIGGINLYSLSGTALNSWYTKRPVNGTLDFGTLEFIGEPISTGMV